MKCPRCGRDNSETSSFCGGCGVPLGPQCASCGHANRIDSRFCDNCGKPINKTARPSQGSNELLSSLSASGGERKRLTVLFADIRNSTELIAAIDPEQAIERIRPVLDAMKEAVHRYDGIVNKLQGDGVMALFGAPQPHEDHAVRGCLAALAMQDAVTRLHDPNLNIRVGLHTGEVVVQAVESSLYQMYDATGVAVHLASRMEQMADEGAILLTASTFNEANQFVEATPLGERAVRGLATPVNLPADGLKHAPASERFRSGPRLSPLSGRERELFRIGGGTSEHSARRSSCCWNSRRGWPWEEPSLFRVCRELSSPGHSRHRSSYARTWASYAIAIGAGIAAERVRHSSK